MNGDLLIEARLLAACIEEPHVLEVLVDLEIDDFSDGLNRVTFEVIRNLQEQQVLAVRRNQQPEQIAIAAIDEALAERDAVRDGQMRELAGGKRIAKLILDTQPYGDDVELARTHAQHLRALREDRAIAPFAPPTEAVRALIETPIDNTWLNMPARVRGELEERKAWAARALSYHNTYVDDCLRAILPHDFILIGAEPGLGKTDFALSIAMGNATHERPTALFALEAEPRELERRTKYSWLSNALHARKMPNRDDFNYTDWLLCKCEHIVEGLNDECERFFLNNLAGLWTYYRGKKFGHAELQREILRVHKLVDLIVIDHLHYIDFDDTENENREVTKTIMAIRDISLRIGKPVVLVAHLKKRDERMKKIVPGLSDFHGTSNIGKVVTQSITIARASKVKAPHWSLAPTYVSVNKDRRAGAPPYVALQFFDRRSRTYKEDYVLGRLVKGDTDWEPVPPGDQPSWARGHRQLELEFV